MKTLYTDLCSRFISVRRDFKSPQKYAVVFIAFLLLGIRSDITGQTFNQITTSGDLTTGEYLIVGDAASGTDGLMVNSTISGPAITYTSISNPGGTISSGFSSNNIFTITVSGSDITIQRSNNDYVTWGRTGVTGNNADFYSGTAANTEIWTASVSGGLWTLKNKSDNTRMLQWNSSSPRFAAYTSSQVKLKLYKKDVSGCSAPTTQASSLSFSSVSYNGMNVNWTNGNGAGRVIIMNTSNSFTAPTDGSNPTANATYSGSGQQVVYNSTGSGPVSISGLSSASTYWFRVYEYCSPDRTYNTSTATGNPNSQATNAKPEPSNFPTSFSCGTTTTSSIPLTWTDATGTTTPDGYLIKWSSTSYAAITTPSDGTPVADGTGVKNVSQGTGSHTFTGLSANTTYYFKIWPYTNSGSNIDYKLGSEPQTSCTTLSGPWEDFETGTKGSYTTGNVTCTAGSWNFNDALLGTDGNDRKNGSQSARIRSTGSITMNFDVGTGIGTVNVLHAKYGSDGNSDWKLEASTDGGSSWTAYASSTITTSSTTLTNQSFTLNLAGSVRFRIVKTSGGSARVNFDDIYITSYSPGTITTGAVSTALCAGAISVNVPFTYSPSGNFPSGTTTFTAQLSNASGSFSSPVSLQSVSSDASGSQSISANIPSNTVTGTGYRIRVVANNPAVNGSDNGGNISIYNSSTSIAPVASQNIVVSQNGTTLTVSEGHTPTSRIWKYGTTSGGPYSTSTGVTATSYTPNFASAGTYYVVCESTYPSPCSNTVSSNEVQVNVTNPQPEIDVKGNGVSIVNGDASPSSGDHTDFGNINWGGSFSRTFTIFNTGSANLTLNSTPSQRVRFQTGSSADFTVTTQPSSNTITPASSLTFTIQFSPSGIGAHNAVILIDNDDSDENPYTFTISGTGTPSNISTIERDNSFTTPQNIAYQNYQETNLTSSSLDVMAFRIRDGGASNNDADNLSTILSSITLHLTNYSMIRQIALYWGSTEISEKTVSGSTVSFSGLSGSGVTATDNTNRIITVKVSFNSTVTDNAQFSISFDPTDVTAQAGNSSFASFSTVSSELSGNRNRVAVTADRLVFSQQASTTTVNLSMNPAVIVKAVDVNGNTDLDFTGSVSLSSTGTMTGAPVIVSAVVGIATYNTLVHTATGTGLELTATTTGLAYSNTVTSAQFNIITFTYQAGDYRPIYDGSDFSWNGYWEEFDGTSWSVAAKGPQNIPQASRPPRIIIDKEAITGGGNYSNTYKTIVVLNGGELILDNNVASPSKADFIGSGDSLELKEGGTVVLNGQIQMNSNAKMIVRSGGSFTINNNNIGSSHAFWTGKENFEPGSELIITDHRNDGGGSSSLINLYSQIDNNTAGSKFGNLTINFSPPSNTWTIVGGSDAITLCDTLKITNGGANPIAMMSNNNSPATVINGNLIHNSGVFGLTANFSGTMSAQTLTINGNLTSNGGTLKLYHSGGGTGKNVLVKLKGNLTVAGSATVSNDALAADCSFNFEGTAPQTISVSPTVTGWRMFGKSGSSIALRNQSLTLGNNSTYTAEGGSIFDFAFDGTNAAGTNALNILDNGASTSFTHQSTAQLIITNPSGIVSTGATGNVQTDSRTFSNVGRFIYAGKANQMTGTALPTTAPGSGDKIVEVNMNAAGLTLTPSAITFLANTDTLWIKQGTVSETASEYFKDGATIGNLKMTGGTYRIAITGTTVPQLSGQSGTYQLTAGTIDLYGSGDQTLRGSRDYYSLAFSTSGTKSLSSSLPANSLDGLITVQDNAILDVSNYTFNGDAGLNMTGSSRFRMSLTGNTLPQLTGVNNPYTLTGGTIELFGTLSNQTHSLRGTYGAGSTISYNHIELNSSAANVSVGGANVVAQAGFNLKGTLTVNSPTCFQLASAYTISDAGVNSTFDLKPGATLKYGGSISASGATGNIQTDIRNFPSGASYGFTGNTSPQTVGSGLPASMKNLYMDKADASNRVVLERHTTVEGTLKLGSSGDNGKGKLDLDGYDLILGTSGTDATVSGGYDDSYVITWKSAESGKIIHNVNTLTATYFYPTGDLNYYTPFNLTLQDADLPLQNATISCQVKAEPHPQLGNSTNFLKRYWTVHENNMSNPEYDVSFSYAPADPELLESTLYPFKYNAGGWVSCSQNTSASAKMGSGNINVGSKTLSWTGLSTFSDFTGIGNGSPLPVTWLRFNAIPENEKVQLEWSTASETNNSHFVIERSTDTKTVVAIGEVTGRGNTNQISNYHFTDYQPMQGISYYRLKQVDFNGGYEYSDWVAVMLESKPKVSVHYLYSDEAEGTLKLVLSGKASFNKIVVVDALGRVCHQEDMRNISQSVFQVRLPFLPRGIYFLQLIGEEETLNQAFRW